MASQLSLSQFLKRLAARNFSLLVVLLATLCLDFLSFFGLGPSFNELIAQVSESANTFSFGAVLALSLTEHLVLVGVYAPFSIAVIAIMSSTAGDPIRGVHIFFAIFFGQAIAYTTNIALGNILRFKYKGGRRIGNRELFLSCSHPHLGAAATFSLGTSAEKPLKSISRMLILLLPWSVFWALFSYFGLSVLIDDVGWNTIFYVYVSIVLALDARHMTRSEPEAN